MSTSETLQFEEWYFEHDKMFRGPIVVEHDDTNMLEPVERRRYEGQVFWDNRSVHSRGAAEPLKQLNDSIQPLGD